MPPRSVFPRLTERTATRWRLLGFRRGMLNAVPLAILVWRCEGKTQTREPQEPQAHLAQLQTFLAHTVCSGRATGTPGSAANVPRKKARNDFWGKCKNLCAAIPSHTRTQTPSLPTHTHRPPQRAPRRSGLGASSRREHRRAHKQRQFHSARGGRSKGGLSDEANADAAAAGRRSPRGGHERSRQVQVCLRR